MSERSDLSLYLEQKFVRLKGYKTLYIAAWKDSLDPKIQVLTTPPNPDKWFFIKCDMIEREAYDGMVEALKTYASVLDPGNPFIKVLRKHGEIK